MSDTIRAAPDPPSETPSPSGAKGTAGIDPAGSFPGSLPGSLLGEVRKFGAELVGAARDSAASMLDAERRRAADQVAAIGTALSHSARELEQSEPTSGGPVARYAARAADGIANFADVLRDRGWRDLAGDVEDFARRWPSAFVASALGLGFVAGRMMRAPAERARDPAGE